MSTNFTVHTLDLNFQDLPGTIASYLVVGPDGAALVETGPASTLESLRRAVAAHGLALTDVKDVLVTHIHLDHAGAAGWLAQGGATVYVHEAGARHLVDPSKLIASATRIYGDEMDRLWGKIVPVPQDRIREVRDGDVLSVGGLDVRAIHSPGHAKHHHVFAIGDTAFTGDVGGVRLEASSFLDLPAPPPEFDREAWQATLEDLLAQDFRVLYPTHFGPVQAVRDHFLELKELVHDAAEFVKARMDEGLESPEIEQSYADWNVGRATRCGVSTEEVELFNAANPWGMSVTGMMRYWRKRG